MDYKKFLEAVIKEVSDVINVYSVDGICLFSNKDTYLNNDNKIDTIAAKTNNKVINQNKKRFE